MKITFLSFVSELSGMNSRLLSAYVRSLGHESAIIFVPTPLLVTSYSEKVIDDIVEICRGSDFVGLSVITPHFPLASQVSEAIHAKIDSKVIWGSMHATILPEECLRFADFVCVGEGEYVLKSLLGRDDPKEIAGLWFKEKNIINRNSHSAMIDDLDILPYQDFSFNNHYYVNPIEEKSCELTSDIYYKLSYKKYRDMKGHCQCFYKTMTSRGCPYSCAYCNNSVHHSMYTKKHFRRRSVENVITELEKVCRRHSFIKLIHLADDSFLSRKTNEIMYFSQLYKEKIGLPLRTITTPTAINETKIKALLDAGLCHLYMGIESGSEKTLERYNRNIKIDTILESAKLLNRHKKKMLKPRYDIMCNDPLGSEEEEKENLEFMLKIPKPRTFIYYNLTFFPGTKIYDEYVKTKGHKPYSYDIPEPNNRSESVNGHTFFVFTPRTYYDVLLVALNSIFIPRWIIKFLSLSIFWKLNKKFPVLNKIGLRILKLLEYFERIINKIAIGEWSAFVRVIQRQFQKKGCNQTG